jgi:neopullulanase
MFAGRWKSLVWIGMCLATVGTVVARAERSPLADCSASQSACVDKVDPPDWWAGLPSPMLLLHGTHLRGAKLSVTGPGVTLDKAEVTPNGHYAFLWLGTKTAASETVTIQVSDANGTSIVPFTLQERTSRGPKGFSAADVMYLIFTDRFADGNLHNDHPAGESTVDRADPHAWHGGDLQGIKEHLDYVQALGATTVWITPVYANNHEPRAYHAYDATDMYDVDPHFGTIEDLHTLSDTLHARNMKLVLDLVPNHVGPQHPWANDPPAPDWFHGTAAEHLRATSNFITLVDPYATPGASRPVTDGWFSDVKPDLNQDDPLVEQYLIQNAMWWVEQAGLDGLRLDTFPYVTRTFWHDFHATLHELYPHLTTVGEIYNHDPSITSFFAGGVKRRGIDSGLDTPFDFPMYSTLRNTLVKGEPMSELDTVIRQDSLYPHPERLVPFLGNHDTSRFLSEPNATIAELKMGFALVATMRGMPELYAGDEIAMRGGKDPDNRHDFPGGFPGDPQNAFTERGKTPEQQDMYAAAAALMHFRAQHPAITEGQQKDVLANSDSFAFVRAVDIEDGCRVRRGESADDRLLIVTNRSDKARVLTFATKKSALAGCRKFTSVFEAGSVASASKSSVALPVGAQSVAIFQVR